MKVTFDFQKIIFFYFKFDDLQVTLTLVATLLLVCLLDNFIENNGIHLFLVASYLFKVGKQHLLSTPELNGI